MYDNIILIPYRNRKEHLDYFLTHSWKLIKEYLPNTKLVIIEQEEGKLFNRGKILNVGFQEYLDKTKYFITQDVDVNPNEQSIILYYKSPLENEIIGIYNSPWKTLGGIIKISNEDIIKINGMPNDFWGWGVEDRVLYNRAMYHKYSITFNILSTTEEASKMFKIFNNINDRNKSTSFSKNTHFEYNIFHTLSNEKQLQHIMTSGLNNLEYTILERRDLEENIELIRVSI